MENDNIRPLYLGSNVKIYDDDGNKTLILANNTTITGINNAVNDTDVVAYIQLIKVDNKFGKQINDLENKIDAIETIKNNQINELENKLKILENTQLNEFADKIKALETKNEKVNNQIQELINANNQQNEIINDLTQYFFRSNKVPKINK
jgi:hypothetical protein